MKYEFSCRKFAEGHKAWLDAIAGVGDEEDNSMKHKPNISIRAYPVIVRAVEEGIAYGDTRAYKHCDSPSREDVNDKMVTAVLDALAEVLDYGDDV